MKTVRVINRREKPAEPPNLIIKEGHLPKPLDPKKEGLSLLDRLQEILSNILDEKSFNSTKRAITQIRNKLL